ncbi:uncharacterized protein [Eurosta solidaginis]|uniref:uncharacterized protein n=1 Tax=Eurosta solidaginis TaxID=178769 RepID=UPI0035314D62
MLKSWSILLLSLFMVLQLATTFPQREQANPTDGVQQQQQAANSAENSFENELSAPRKQLLFGTLTLLTKQSKSILVESRTFLKHLINEMKALPNKSAAIERNITRLDEVLHKIDAIDLDANPPLVDEMFSAVDELGKVYDEFYGMPESTDPQSDVVNLENLFEKVGSESLEQRLNNSLQATLNEFPKLFETFKQTLIDAEQQNETQLLEWYRRFKTENDNEKKFNLLEEFWTFFK